MEEDYEDNVDNTETQGKSRNYDHIKPWQFKPGQSGNPGGMKKGTVSLKTFAKRYIQDLSDEEKLEFMKGLDKRVVWEMAEGKPKQDTDITSGGESINAVLVKFLDGKPKDN